MVAPSSAAPQTSRRYLGRRWQLLRVLLPTWRFFDDPGDEPELLVRSGADANTLGPWRACLEPVARGPGALFLNAKGNYLLAARSLVEQLLSDLADWDEGNLGPFSESVSFRLVKNLVEYELRGELAYQFKIAARSASGDPGDVLISPVFRGV